MSTITSHTHFYGTVTLADGKVASKQARTTSQLDP